MATTDAQLSRLLFSARESLSMLADIVEARANKPDTHNRVLVAQIDVYRAERGWSPDGFGGEQESAEMRFDLVDRVDIIDAEGRAFTGSWKPGAYAMLQDDDRTLKIFLGEPK